MGNRNKISLEKINEIHQFSNNPVFTDPQPNPTVPVVPPYQNANPYQTNPYNNPNPQPNFTDPFAPTSNINPFGNGNPYQNGPGVNQTNIAQPASQQQDFFIPPVNPNPPSVNPNPPSVNPISRPPFVQPLAPFNDFNDIKLNDINKIEDIPLYPDMDM